ncbi:hypothetical protein IWQ47_001973 [Aquimarina sp. EL_43]|uniref:hypothetical protein n=1 Tax=Aquimarina TaxID=290174 RepID=UPI0004723C63|nr:MULTISPECIES: hypothetical protein [Aquimarina]MBG6129944.1 hypothetical protein [Aquimarina sp. EL_35]MBG6148724.1 hypothetical protein [Aquimarina sp. EL_32]MBG6168902.1 hypothetical protein [Aquimarina sp. EL_43]
MKEIKNIVLIINALAFVTTLGCYGIMGEKDGLFAQIFLGGIQLGIGLGFFIQWKKRSAKVKKNVLVYWGIVLLYGVLFQMETNDLHMNSNRELIFLEIIPMCIAAYSVFITYLNIKDK